MLKRGTVSLITIACAALLLAASAGASPSVGANLSILPWQHGVFGYVKSSTPGVCAAGRQVQVFVRLRGGNRRVGTATARRRDGRYQWSIKTNHARELFAAASARRGCRAAQSTTLPPKGGLTDVPNCPSNAAVCYFPRMHGDMLEIRECPGFTRPSGSCGGDSTGGVAPWSWAQSEFAWEGDRWDGPRSVSYWSYYSKDDEHSAVAASLVGDVPGPGSADYAISTASDQHGPDDTKDTTWYTPNVAGAAAGTEGGPLWLDFENGSWGFDIYIWGYLYKK
jgi:hypothetical protein